MLDRVLADFAITYRTMLMIKVFIYTIFTDIRVTAINAIRVALVENYTSVVKILAITVRVRKREVARCVACNTIIVANYISNFTRIL
jgi:hypothetical protein